MLLQMKFDKMFQKGLFGPNVIQNKETIPEMCEKFLDQTIGHLIDENFKLKMTKLYKKGMY